MANNGSYILRLTRRIPKSGLINREFQPERLSVTEMAGKEAARRRRAA
jgi:hypothetical protein